MSTYVKWAKEDIVPTLEIAGFKIIELPRTNELVFERDVDRALSIKIRIYSSISGNAVRNKGKDAARVVLMYGDKAVWKSKRVHRTQGFLENLLKRCREAYASVCQERCPQCNAPMILRHQKKDDTKKFWGCANFPLCRFSYNIK